jgi:integrase
LLPFDLKFNQGVLRVSKAINDDGEPRGWTKTGLNRNLEITPELAAELSAHIATTRAYFEKLERPLPIMLFPSTTGSYLEIRNVRRLFKKICTLAGIHGFTP